jgi:predicted transcriptional regulator
MPEAIAKTRVSSVTLKIDKSYRERLKSLAVQKNRSAHYLMKEAIDRYLKAEEAQQAVLTSVDEAIAHYEVTGLHLSHAEVKAWAQELKTNPQATLPECHA